MSLVDPTQPQEGANPQVEDKPKAPELPEKLQGKSVEEIAKMYADLEADRGRLANEVHETRQLTDRLLKIEESRTVDTPQTPEEPISIDPTDLLADPTATISKYFEQREAKLRSEYDAKINQLENAVSNTAVSVQHQDANEILNSPEFVEYCKGDSFRFRTAQMAAAGDRSALVDLINSYKQQASNSQEAPASTRSAPQFEGSADAPAPSGEILKRTDIVRKKLEDPEGYLDPAYQALITKAYQEGRVR